MGWVDRFVHDPIDAVTDNKFTSSPQGILAGVAIATGAGALLTGGLDSILGTGAAAAGGDSTAALGALSGADPATAILTGGSEAGVADAAGPGFTFDLEGNAIANDAAAQVIPAQQAGGAVQGWADSLSSPGGLSAAQTTQIQNAASATGWSTNDILSALKTGGTALGALTNALGAYGQYQTAKGAGQAIGQAATQAGNILAAGSKEAAGLQAAASTGAAQTLSSASLAGGQQLSQASTQAAQTLAGGYQQAGAAQAADIGSAIGTAQQTLAQQTANQQPYMQAGTQALSQLTAGLQAGGQFNRPFTMADAQNTAAYQFALGQGEEAIKRNAALGGTQLSSANLENLNTFAQGTASQYEQQAFNQWMSQNNLTLGGLQNLVQTGQISTSQLQQALGQAGVSIETLQQNLGNANATAALGAAGATAGGINQAAGQLTAGQLGAAQAQAAGQVGSAGYTASGITGAAQAQAAGLVGSTNAQQAGNVAAGNIKSQGLSSAGNLLTQSGALQYLMNGGTSAPNANQQGGAGSVPNILF